MLGRPPEAAGSPLGGGVSGGGRFQLEKSGRVRPSGGTSYSSASVVVVLGVVGPPEEAATPYPESAPSPGSMFWWDPASRLPGMCTRVLAGSRICRSPLPWWPPVAGAGPSW